MKEIKFRAFYKPSKKGKKWEEMEVGMHDVVAIRWKEWLTSATLTKNGVEKGKPWLSEGLSVNLRVNQNDPKSAHIWVTPREIELMQYTGIKDQNGLEVWEGDLVERNGYIHEIYYDDGEWRMAKNGSKADIHMLSLEYKGVKVVGDIYQNKELIAK